ncbi:Acetyltransferase (GNAT) family protein [Amycolatopsis marina]|uniref:Acetyltransferase (GNAT) family protein n=1 Tax=Amycolatopsis marina TaxID=490629 RepID=A0A1I1C8V7_9PSEU|nr:Acetyltransferase (GNAT) family protein [Amycolatopsis marina]
MPTGRSSGTSSVGGAPIPFPRGAVTAILESMRVIEEQRRKRIGVELVPAFLAWAGAEGANQATVTAYASDDAASGLYRSHGFESFELTMRRTLR